MPALDLAMGHGMIRRAAQVFNIMLCESIDVRCALLVQMVGRPAEVRDPVRFPRHRPADHPARQIAELLPWNWQPPDISISAALPPKLRVLAERAYRPIPNTYVRTVLRSSDSAGITGIFEELLKGSGLTASSPPTTSGSTPFVSAFRPRPKRLVISRKTEPPSAG